MRKWLCVPEYETLRSLKTAEGLLCVPKLRLEIFLERGICSVF